MRILDHPLGALPATLADLGARWVESGRGRPDVQPHLSGLRFYVEFIGYPASGHSLVGALLDAHPEIVLAHELGALKYLYAGFDRERVFWMILAASRRAAATSRRTSSYHYDVEGAWAGRFERLRVIGDKHGEGAARRFGAFPGLLPRLRRAVRLELRFLHVVRNPWDVIASTRRRLRPRGRPLDLDGAADYFFELCGTVEMVRASLGPALLDVEHERIVADPEGSLRQLCGFLELEAPPRWLESCRALVRPAPHLSRHETTWTAAQVDAVARRAARFPWLAGYRFEA